MPRTISVPYLLILVFTILFRPDSHALKLTKDTVKESLFSNPASRYATWNDSLSLINTTGDTLSMEGIYFIVPQGKQAQLQIGYKSPYHPAGDIVGPVLKPGQRYRAFEDSARRILPGQRIPISGFLMETCIECPGSGGTNTGASQDTLKTFVVFDTKVASDTLVVIGTINSSPNGIRFFYPPSKAQTDNGGTGFIHQEFFNTLGRTVRENRTRIRDPMILKFK